MDAQVLYRDAAVVVCRKPPGVLSEPGAERNLPAMLSAFFTAQGEPGEVYTVHRLDREVGGLMVLARTHEAAASLIAQIAERSVDKEYLAVLRGKPAQPAAVLEDLLFRDAAKNKSFVVKRERKGVRKAKLAYRLLGTADDSGQPLSLVRIRLFTGRTHQIRVQFASRALPLVGDGRYGGRDDRCRIALFSCALSFRHPTTGQRLSFFQPPDLTQFPWKLFPSDTYVPETLFSDSTSGGERT